jgi:Co/Zn/Cd efflux system component
VHTDARLLQRTVLIVAALNFPYFLDEFAVAPDVAPLVLASLGAIAINGTSARLLTSLRHAGGSLSRAAFLSARNDVLLNVAIIAMGVVTVWTQSGWPDLVPGSFIILLALHAACEVWEVSEEERLAAKAPAGEPID